MIEMAPDPTVRNELSTNTPLMKVSTKGEPEVPAEPFPVMPILPVPEVVSDELSTETPTPVSVETES